MLPVPPGNSTGNTSPNAACVSSNAARKIVCIRSSSSSMIVSRSLRVCVRSASCSVRNLCRCSSAANSSSASGLTRPSWASLRSASCRRRRCCGAVERAPSRQRRRVASSGRPGRGPYSEMRMSSSRPELRRDAFEQARRRAAASRGSAARARARSRSAASSRSRSTRLLPAQLGELGGHGGARGLGRGELDARLGHRPVDRIEHGRQLRGDARRRRRAARGGSPRAAPPRRRPPARARAAARAGRRAPRRRARAP